MTLRRARPEDAAGIARVQRLSWREAYADLVPAEVLEAHPDERAASWRAWLGADVVHGRWTWVDAEDGEVVGFVTAGPCRDADVVPSRSGEVYALYLLPERWGQGRGRVLLGAAVDALRAEGYEEAILWVLTGNARGRRFYEAAGFAADGARRRFFAGASEGMRYRLDLFVPT